jgi:hypothetical protein
VTSKCPSARPTDFDANRLDPEAVSGQISDDGLLRLPAHAMTVAHFTPGTETDVAFTLTGAAIKAIAETRTAAARRWRRIYLAAVGRTVVLILTVSWVVAS